jgi:hypothetical protein
MRSGKTGNARRMCERGGARYFVFITRMLSPTDALSHAIVVSDIQDLCYGCSWFPKKGCARGRKRGGHWIPGRLLRSRRSFVWRGAAAAHLRTSTRAGAGRRGGRFGEKSGSQSRNLDSPARLVAARTSPTVRSCQQQSRRHSGWRAGKAGIFRGSVCPRRPLLPPAVHPVYSILP